MSDKKLYSLPELPYPYNALEPFISEAQLAWPNPSANFSTISYTVGENGSVEIGLYDIAGKKIREIVNHDAGKGSYSIRLDVSQLCNGLYFCRMKTHAGEKVIKILVGS